MSTERDVAGIVRSWLEDGAASLPGRVLDDVLAQVPTTPQRRAPWPAWRFHSMSSPLKFALVAAAVGALALVSLDVLPRSPDIVGAPAPSSSTSPSPGLIEGYAPSLAAGTYRQPLGTGTWTVTVPEGWAEFYGTLWKDVDGVSTTPTAGPPGEVVVGWELVTNVFADPCHWKDSLLDPPVGSTVDDLATAFAERVGGVASGPTDVVFGGHPAQKIVLSVPADLDVATCDEGSYRDFLVSGEVLSQWTETPDIAGRINVLYILDVDGARYVMQTRQRPDASEADLAELDAILASIVIDRPAPSPAASPSSTSLAWSPASLEQDWPAPVREEPVGDPVIIPLADGYLDPRGDIESPAWIDIVHVNHSLVDYAASAPDGPAGPDEPWIAYGLVFDTDLDGVADVRLGMDRVPAELTPWGGTPGDTDVRAWRTDLRAGTTEFGPTGSSRAPCDCLSPYDPSGGVATAHFHPHEAIPGRFYAWASVIQDGRVLATDYAPDTGWLDTDS